MSINSGFRQTEAGLIPEEWEVATVGDEFSVQLGKMLDSEKNVGVPKPFVGNRAIQWGRVDLTDLGVVKLTPSELQRFRLQDGDLLVCEGGEIGRSAIWCNPIEECYYQKALHRLRPKRGYNVLLMRYMLERLVSIGFLARFVTQTSIAHLPKNKFETVPISIPPTSAEQQAIADALSDADAFIESLAQLLAKKRALKQGAVQALLTGKKRLPGFERRRGLKRTEAGIIPEDWEIKPLDSIAFVTSGKRLPLGKSLTEQETPHPYVRVTDMRPGTVSLAAIAFIPVDVFPRIKRYRIFRDDIFISVAGTIGIVGKIPAELDGANLTENADRITNIACSRDYLLHVLMSPLIQNVIGLVQTVGAQPKLALTRIRRFDIPVPPMKAEQEAIAEALGDMDADCSALEERLAKARNLKQGLMQQLLTGKIRLI